MAPGSRRGFARPRLRRINRFSSNLFFCLDSVRRRVMAEPGRRTLSGDVLGEGAPRELGLVFGARVRRCAERLTDDVEDLFAELIED